MRQCNLCLVSLLVAIVFCILAGVALVFSFSGYYFSDSDRIVQIGDLVIPVEIADTNEERMRGLSGRMLLDQNAGMLFVFDYPGFYRFWMPDMYFPLDIIWIDENKKIIAIDANVLPLPDNTKPIYYIPPSSAQYVLEVNAGFATKNNLRVGDIVSFDI